MRSSVTGSAPVGKYALEVGAYAGSFAHFASTSSGADKAEARKNAAALRAALAEQDEGGPSYTPLKAVEELEESADAVTDRVEHATKLFKAASQDRLFDRNLLTGEIGALLGLLDRLDREGRYEEEIRVAKALHGLCVLAFRWLDLVRSLRSALAAARGAGDDAGQAWALNELGALHLCAGDPKKAQECLERALKLQETLGDAAGRCASRHNCDSARRDFARPIQVGPPRRLRMHNGAVRALLIAGIAAVAALVAVGSLAIAPIVASGGGKGAAVDVVSDAGANELVATIGEGPPKLSASPAASFSFSAKGAEGFECKLDDQAFMSCRSPAHYLDVKEGKHSFQVRATAKGEQGSAAQYVWRIDLTAPRTTITAKPSGRTTMASATFRFEANEKVKKFQCKLDDDPFATCTSPKNFPGPLDEGEHTFAVRSTDLAGNFGDAKRYQWRIVILPNPKTAVPDIVGMQLASGIDALKGAQLKWETEETASAEPIGEIVDQDPTAGEEVPRGATIEISVSIGSPLPDLTVTIHDSGVEVSCPVGVGSCVTTVTFTVTNQGKGDIAENFDVLVSADPSEEGTVTVRGGLAAGTSTERTKQLGPGGNCFDPDCFVQVAADPTGNVLELDERNNVAEWSHNG